MDSSRRSRILGVGLVVLFLIAGGALYYLTQHMPSGALLSPSPPGTISPGANAPEGNRGLALMDQGRLQEAKAYYEAELKQSPRSAEMLKGLGDVYLRLRQPGTALTYFEQAAAQAPDNSRIYESIGAAYLGLGKGKEAEAAFRKALKLTPDSPLAYRGLGDSFLQRNLAEDAVRTYQEGLKLNPDNMDLYLGQARAYEMQGQFDRALRIYDQALKRNSDYLFIYHQRARFYMSRGEPELALVDFNTALSRAPHDPDSLAGRGLIYLFSGQLDRARTDLEAALKVSPELDEARRSLVNINLQERKYNQAEKLVKPVLSRPNPPPWAHAAMGCIEAGRGQPDKAARSLAQAYRAAGTPGGASRDTEELLNAMTDRKQVLRALEQAAGLERRNAEIQVLLGNMLLAGGDVTGARQAFLAASKAAPNRIMGYLGLAQVAIRAGDSRQAKAMVSRALNARWEDITQMETLGFIALKIKDYPDAEIAFREALSREPGRSRSVLGMVNALLGEGKSRAAMTFLEDAVRKSPGNKLLADNLRQLREAPQSQLAVGQEILPQFAPPLSPPPSANLPPQSSSPEQSDNQLQLGNWYLEQGQYGKALQLFSTARKNNPASEGAALGCARTWIMISLEKPHDPDPLKKADELLAANLGSHPASGETLLLMAVSEMKQNRVDLAAGHANQALGLLKDSRKPQGNLVAALATLRCADRTKGARMLEQTGKSGIDRLDSHDPDILFCVMASEFGRLVFTGTPSPSQLQTTFAADLEYQGNLDYERVRRLMNSMLEWSRSLQTKNKSQNQKALSNLLPLLETKPGDDIITQALGLPFLQAVVHGGQGDFLRATGQSGPAGEEYQQSLDAFPGNPYIQERLRGK